MNQRWQGWREVVYDGLPAAVALVTGLAGTTWAGSFQGMPSVERWAYGLVVVAALALLVRRRWPLPVLAVSAAAVSVYLFRGYPFGPILISLFIAVYTVAARLPAGRAAVASGLALVAMEGHAIAGAGAGIAQVVPSSAWVVVPFALGVTIRLTRESAIRQQADQAHRLVDQERLRIAQEVHDVVGHGLAAINMQARIALHLLDKRPEQAATALTAISASSKEALDELRVTLGVVRTGTDQDADRGPAPGLDQLGALRTRMAGAGLQTTVAVTGSPRALPAAVNLAAYRVAQEALTNVLRHAGAASAAVVITYEDGAVAVEVTDSGRSEPGGVAPTGPGSGHGLTGMRERITVLGGELEAGPLPGGGFRVHARLPTKRPITP